MASHDVTISGPICGSKLQRVFALPSGAPGLHAFSNYFGINFRFDHTYTYTFNRFGNWFQECNQSPLGLHLHSGDYTYTLKLFSGQVRPRQGTEICNFGAPSPLEALHWIFLLFSSIYVQFSKTSPTKSGESSEKSCGENRVKSCHVCGCHGFFGPDVFKLFSQKFHLHFHFLY